jgi:hypothetical protein
MTRELRRKLIKAAHEKYVAARSELYRKCHEELMAIKDEIYAPLDLIEIDDKLVLSRKPTRWRSNGNDDICNIGELCLRHHQEPKNCERLTNYSLNTPDLARNSSLINTQNLA